MCRSPTSESFQRLCANEKRRGGGGVGGGVCHHLVKAEPLLIFSSSGLPRPLHMSYPPVAIAMPPHVVDSECSRSDARLIGLRSEEAI